MSATMILNIAFLCIMVIAGIIFFAVEKKQKNKSGISLDKQEQKRKTDEASKKKTEDAMKKNVLDFMEFDEVKDDMIVQNNGTKYTRVIKCQGINYDLLAEGERIAVEEGFISFLNTLRFPVQLYVQSRTVNMRDSINRFKERDSESVKELDDLKRKYTELEKKPDENSAKLEMLEYEMTKLENKIEYTEDIIYYIDRMSLNRNILKKEYYVIVSYFTSEIISMQSLTTEDVYDLAYRELYTRCQAITGGLASCAVQGRMLSANELSELLYIAYNRDDADIINISDALDSGFYRLYSSSEDVIEKKNTFIQKALQEEALITAQEALQKAINEGSYVAQEDVDFGYQKEVNKIALMMLDNAREDYSEHDIENAISEIVDRIINEEREHAEVKDKKTKKEAKKKEESEVSEDKLDDVNPIAEDEAIEVVEENDGDVVQKGTKIEDVLINSENKEGK